MDDSVDDSVDDIVDDSADDSVDDSVDGPTCRGMGWGRCAQWTNWRGRLDPQPLAR